MKGMLILLGAAFAKREALKPFKQFLIGLKAN
jgi:hypothetical protein